ncbi:HNH endonuclease [Caldifermentibacillus hisashii]|uniref:HNH endonuclease n=1 Tax=Caldifermentibacillus hisashii TaxID=996558 RepID=UPI0038CF8071
MIKYRYQINNTTYKCIYFKFLVTETPHFFKTFICETLGLNPYSFKKRNGEYYIENHHVIPRAKLESGSLSTNNLLTVCANHHRQIHYGNVELLENTNDYFVYSIDGKNIKIKKYNG